MLKCCYPLKSELKNYKIDVLVQIKGIEGIPFITRFKTAKTSGGTAAAGKVLRAFHL